MASEDEVALRLVPHADRAALGPAVAARLAAALQAAIAARGRATLIATGGSTAPLIYDALAAAKLDWARVHVVLSDERAVPEDHPLSNARMVRERLLRGPAAAATFQGFAPGPDGPEAAARRFAARSANLFPADAALLGVGEDLHVASIFPAGDGMEAALHGEALALATTPDPLPEAAPVARITLSMRVLIQAHTIFVALTGDAKRANLEQAAQAGASAPILSLVRAADVELHWAP